MTINLFFELIQVSIGVRLQLSHQPTANEWEQLYEISKRHSLLGICYVGILRLGSFDGIPKQLLMRWCGYANLLKAENLKVNAQVSSICQQYSQEGMECCVLKGQGNLFYYDQTVRDVNGNALCNLRDYRTHGDIDLWCRSTTCSNIHIINYVLHQHQVAGTECKDIRYNHVEAPLLEETEVEIHYRPLFFCSPIRNHRLQQWLSSYDIKNTPWVDFNGVRFPVPTSDFNLVYQLGHVFRHLFEHGVGLRQLLDYNMVLRRWHEENGNLNSAHLDYVVHLMKRLGLYKFLSAMMYVQKRVFELPDKYLLCAPNEKEGRFLLAEVMRSGNFGRYDTRLHGNSKHGRWNLAVRKTYRNMAFLTHYPEEVLSEPCFRLWHWGWRCVIKRRTK